jgi:Concanavalin A-like lectin/glucanases superfamily
VPDPILLFIPLAVLALVAVLGFVGCTKDFDSLVVSPPAAPMPYADEVLASGPIAYWRLSDPPGNLAKDEIGSPPSGDHPGEYQGNVTLGQPPGLNLSDPNATPARFDGTGFVEVVHDPVFESSTFTVEAFVYPDSVSEAGVIVGSMSPPAMQGAPSMSAGWGLFIVPRSPTDEPEIDGYFAAVVGDGAVTPAGPPPEPFDLTKLGTAWHLAMTFDGMVLTLYWDGVKGAWGSFPYAPDTQAPLLIGLGFKGAIQEVAVYAQALTAEQIGIHFLANTSPIENS